MLKHQTHYDIANTIRLSRTQFKGIFVLVEGETDVRVYGRIFQNNEYRTVVSNGKDNAIQALMLLEKEGAKDVFAIADADFDRLNSKDYEDHNIFLTDYHDLESMILNSPAFEKF